MEKYLDIQRWLLNTTKTIYNNALFRMEEKISTVTDIVRFHSKTAPRNFALRVTAQLASA